ncbi:transporter substrate-binding domain-containing protein [uncultured Pseudomonas sp.]|uniref:transporter substrate-binding domain-containing protein n=1 Tax=uncultured Pseudomonas sp. TaxID=114707 RepID=UPI0025E7D950|nr:transporter substrate-binding domain-containing protein [uncultured Pseudomonas sp.]
MTPWLRRLLLILTLTVSAAALADSQPRQLLARSLSASPALVLSQDDRQWLDERKVLVLGSSQPDYPPFEINISPQDYEGLSADYAGLIGEQLGIPITVQRFASRTEAIDALRRGQIDLLGSSNGFEAQDGGLALSHSYADDLPVIVTRQDRPQLDDQSLAGMTLAMVDHYVPASTVRALYPQTRLKLYRSTQAGLSAVALGSADAYIGDAISSDYAIGRAYQGLVRIDHFVPTPAGSFAFALDQHNVRLLKLVDQALERITDSERLNILRRWSSGNTSLLLQRRLATLTAEEQQWLVTAPTLQVLVNPSLAPLTFNDSQQQPTGITLEVLKQISLRTGLRFEIVERDSVAAMVDEVASGAAHMAGALDYSRERASRVRFTRPYLISPTVRVVRRNAPLTQRLDDQRIALVRGASPHVALLQRYPAARVIESDNALTMMESVAKGEADVALISQIAAAYYLTHVFKDKLRIAGLQDDEQSVAAFAVSPDLPVLQSILDKALLSIPPDELDQLINRWRTSTIASDSLWGNYRSLALQVLVLSAVLLAGVVFWNGYLRKLIHQRSEAQQALQTQLTLSRSLLEQLRLAKEEAERASQAKSSFLAIMSHEIRTPMNAIMGLLELALNDHREGRSDPQGLQTAHDAARGLLDLIGDILDISRIESGHMTLQRVPADLVELVRSVLRAFEANARLKGLALQANLPDAPTWVSVDAVRLRQIIANLISNAIKFTDQGQVDVRLRTEPDAEGWLHVELQVQDSGIGISQADQTRLFKAFGQLDSQRVRHGAGLGLVISRTLCQLMAGELHLQSLEGVGTRVEVRLRLQSATPVPSSGSDLPIEVVGGNPLRILVADDYPANLMLLEKQLHSLGHHVSLAENGEAAWVLWQAEDFDVVLTDCSMPVMDGHELTRRIRALERERGLSPCTILGITANAQAEARAQCLADGMNDCLFKPIGLQLLKAHLPQAPARTPDRPESGFDLAQLRHLTQDDASLTRRLLEQLARSTAEDLQALRALPPDSAPAELKALVHRIKGGARMLKVRGVVRDCEALEQALADDSPSAEHLRRLETNLQGLELELRQGLNAIAGSN